MGRAACRFTEADIRRAIKVAKQQGACGVEIKPDGTIAVNLSPLLTEDQEIADASKREIVP
jgi:hypothetical protein